MEYMKKSSQDLTTNVGELLAVVPDFWEYWGFIPWQHGCFKGVAREQHFIKRGFLGPIAEYGAWEAIVWECGSQGERDVLWNSCKSIPEVMTQRYLFLLEDPWTGRKIRSLAWGFKGYVEYYSYWPGFTGDKMIKDLTGLVDLALAIK